MMRVGGLRQRFRTYRSFRSFNLPTIPAFLFQAKPGADRDAWLGLRDGSFSTIRLLRSYDRERLPRAFSIREAFFRKCVMMGTGIGILYGVMERCGVAAGNEFLTADEFCRRSGNNVICVDINDTALGRKLLKNLRPTFWNLVYNLLTWLAMPRDLWRTVVYAIGNSMWDEEERSPPNPGLSVAYGELQAFAHVSFSYLSHL